VIFPDTITDREISDAYHASRLRRIGYGLAKALTTQAVYIALRCTARAMRRRQQRGASISTTGCNET